MLGRHVHIRAADGGVGDGLRVAERDADPGRSAVRLLILRRALSAAGASARGQTNGKVSTQVLDMSVRVGLTIDQLSVWFIFRWSFVREQILESGKILSVTTCVYLCNTQIIKKP